jgi:predicted RNA binding protein YcfA (HicA-like mRNA interferase family)
MRKNRKLIKKLEDRGWSMEHTRNGHMKFTFPDTGDFLIAASSASDCRAEKNLLAHAKRIEEGRAHAC